jgi:hypothetical protein
MSCDPLTYTSGGYVFNWSGRHHTRLYCEVYLTVEYWSKNLVTMPEVQYELSQFGKYEATSSFAPPDGRERVKLGLGATATIAVRTAQAKGVFGIFNRAYSAHHVPGTVSNACILDI